MFTYTLTKPNYQESTCLPPTFHGRRGPPVPWIEAFHAYNAPLSLPRPPTIYLELREEDLKEAVQDVLSQLNMHIVLIASIT